MLITKFVNREDGAYEKLFKANKANATVGKVGEYRQQEQFKYSLLVLLLLPT